MSLDSVLTQLTENTDPEDTDLLLVVHDPGVAPETQKVTVENFRETDPNRPTDDEKAALAGTVGGPSSANKYVTNNDSRNTDARTPTTHAPSHAAAGSDPVSLSWTQVDKSGSSLADLATRSASDLNSGTLAPARGGTGIGSFTSGSFPFVASGVLSEDPKLFWDNTNKRLGVGTNAPQTLLAVNANAAGAPGADSTHIAQFNQADGLLASVGIHTYGSFPTITFRRANTGQSAKSSTVSRRRTGLTRPKGQCGAGWSPRLGGRPQRSVCVYRRQEGSR
jgi:hypothetical protein